MVENNVWPDLRPNAIKNIENTQVIEKPRSLGRVR